MFTLLLNFDALNTLGDIKVYGVRVRVLEVFTVLLKNSTSEVLRVIDVYPSRCSVRKE